MRRAATHLAHVLDREDHVSTISDNSHFEADALSLVHETLLGEAFSKSSMLAFAADDDMRYVAVNDAACKLLGYSRSEMLQLRVSDVASEVSAPDISSS